MRYERMLDTDRRIRQGEFPSVSEIAGFWEVSERTVKRDIEYMKDRLYAPIVYDRSKRGYFYSEPSWSLPAITLKQGDLFSLLIAHHALAQYQGLPVTKQLEQVYSNLMSAVGEQITIDPEDLLGEFSFVAMPSIPVDPDIWETVSHGVLQRRVLTISYQSKRNENLRTHTVEPYHMANIQGDWYVFARNRKYEGVRQFAIGRMAKAILKEEKFVRPRDFDPAELISHAFGGFASMEQMREVCIRVSNTWSLEVKDRQWHARQKVRHLKNGDVEISFPVSSSGKRPYFNVIRWVLGMGRHARVVKPAQLKRLVAEEVKAMAERSV